MWLFGYEFPSVIMALTPDAFHIIATKKKGREKKHELNAQH
jgi:nucleosome binding factor SPN SPT16 subunit